MENVEKAKSERLRLIREGLGWGQQRMADELHIDRSYLSQLENGKKPLLDWIIERAEVLAALKPVENPTRYPQGQEHIGDELADSRRTTETLWPLLSDATIRSAISDLSQNQACDDDIAIIHLEGAVAETRRRRRMKAATSGPTIGGVPPEIAKTAIESAAVAQRLAREASKYPRTRKAASPSGSTSDPEHGADRGNK